MSNTYRDLIAGAYRLIGVISEGEVPTGAQGETAIYALNEMIDEWNGTDALLYTTSITEHVLTASQTYTIGPTGDIVVPVRPVRLYGAWIRDTSNTPNTDRRLTVIDALEWGNLVTKGFPADDPYYVYMDANWPQATLYLYPAPSGASRKLILHFLTTLDSDVALEDTESLPPAYRKALRYNLAVSLAPEFGKEAPQTVQTGAMTSKMIIQQGNFVGARMDFDTAGAAEYDIYGDSSR